MYEGLIQNESMVRYLKISLFTSVPVHPSKLRQRGYNHAELLAKNMAEKLRRPYSNLLTRVKKTSPQYKLGKTERASNIKGAFIMSHNIGNRLENSNIILVDDVATTYSTLRECAHTLKKNGAGKVIAVTFAKET